MKKTKQNKKTVQNLEVKKKKQKIKTKTNSEFDWDKMIYTL